MEMNESTLNRLRELYSETEERGGYITNDGFVIEVENIHPDKTDNFMFSCDDLDKLDSLDVMGTFHTHPNKSSNLSKEDYDAFVNWEKLLHFIIGQDKISCYKVSDKCTVIIEPIVEIKKNAC